MTGLDATGWYVDQVGWCCAGGELQVDEDLASKPRVEEERLTEAEKNQRLQKQLEVRMQVGASARRRADLEANCKK